MYEKGRRKGTIRFSIEPTDDVARVSLAGDFNGWRPQAMQRQKDGTFVRVVPVAPGPHEYKYIVEGEWVTDPDVNVWAANCYGTVNSVLSNDS